MKRVYQTLLLLLIIPLWGHAQETSASGPFTLDQCIKYALENTIDIKNARIDEKISQAQVKETRGIGLPQVNAEVSVLHNQKLPRFFGPNTTDTTQFSFFQNVEGAKDGDIVAGRNFFQ